MRGLRPWSFPVLHGWHILKGVFQKGAAQLRNGKVGISLSTSRFHSSVWNWGEDVVISTPTPIRLHPIASNQRDYGFLLQQRKDLLLNLCGEWLTQWSSLDTFRWFRFSHRFYACLSETRRSRLGAGAGEKEQDPPPSPLRHPICPQREVAHKNTFWSARRVRGHALSHVILHHLRSGYS